MPASRFAWVLIPFLIPSQRETAVTGLCSGEKQPRTDSFQAPGSSSHSDAKLTILMGSALCALKSYAQTYMFNILDWS